MQPPFPEALSVYSLVIGPVYRRSGNPQLAAHMIVGQEILPDPSVVTDRVGALKKLVVRRKAETPHRPLPDDFPVFVAHISGVKYTAPDKLDVTFDATHLSYRPDRRDKNVREICGAVTAFIVEGPDVFPPPLAPEFMDGGPAAQ